MAQDESEPPRFGQLTYTSFDRPGESSGGGWQVKESTGGLDPEEQEALRVGVVTRFESPQSFPRFPTPEEVRDRPRRLMYVPGENSRGLYWHTAPAGADASGRPGNVFAHCLLDRGDPADSVRPIERWRSRDWLVPYGADEVAAAVLSDKAPRLAEHACRKAVLDFLLDSETWRIGVFSVLLDGVARALDGGSPVVLGCRTPDDAALWIGAVSHFMSPGTAMLLGWSTFDRLYSVDDAVARGAHLVTVPLEDLPGDLPGCVVFGADESPELGELDGEPHLTANGDTVPVTPWSLLAQTALIDRAIAANALARQDEIAASVGDRALNAMWPLAMAVVSDPDLHDALDEATSVLLEHTPDGVDSTDFSHLVDGIVHGLLGDTLEQAADVLARWRADDTLAPAVWRIAGAVFGYRVLEDPASLRDGDRARLELLEYCPRTEDLMHKAAQMLADLRQRARSGHRRRETAVEAYATLDALVRADLLGAAGLDIAHEVLELAVVPVLFDEQSGSDFVAEVGAARSPALGRLLHTAVVTHPAFAIRPLGTRLSHRVIAWLTGTPVAIPTFEDIRTDPSLVLDAANILVAEAGAAHIHTGEGDLLRRDVASVALWRAFSELYEGGWPGSDVAALVERAGWKAMQWNQVCEIFPHVAAPRFLQDAVVTEPWNTDVEALAHYLRRVQVGDISGRWVPDPQHDELAGSWAQIRLSDHWTGISATALGNALELHVRPVLEDYAQNYAADLPDDVRSRLAVFLVAFCAPLGRDVPQLPPDHEAALVDAVDRDAQYVVDALVDLVRSGALDVYWVIVNAVFTSLSAPHVRSVLDRRDLLARFEVGPPSARTALLDAVASVVLTAPGYRGPRDARGLMDAIRTELHDRRHRDVDYACDIYAGFVGRWLEERLLGHDEMSWDRERRRR